MANMGRREITETSGHEGGTDRLGVCLRPAHFRHVSKKLGFFFLQLSPDFGPPHIVLLLHKNQ